MDYNFIVIICCSLLQGWEGVPRTAAEYESKTKANN